MAVDMVARMAGVVLLASLLFCLLVPTGAAQRPIEPNYLVEANVSYENTHVEPLTEQRAVLFEVSVQCHSAGLEHGLESHTLRYKITSDRAWAAATLSKQEDPFTFGPDECVEQTARTFTVEAEITFSREAPAFWRTMFRFQAMMDTGESRELKFDLSPGFTGPWEASIETPILQARTNSLIDIPVQIVNHGNGPIVVKWKLAEGTSPALQVALPPQQVVQSVIAGGETSTLEAPITILTPRDTDSTHALALILAATSADDTSLALEPKQVETVVQTTGSDAEMNAVGELPSVTASLMVALVGLAAFLARRRP